MNRIPDDIRDWAMKLEALDVDEVRRLWIGFDDVAKGRISATEDQRRHAVFYAHACSAKIDGRSPLGALEDVVKLLPDGAVIR